MLRSRLSAAAIFLTVSFSQTTFVDGLALNLKPALSDVGTEPHWLPNTSVKHTERATKIAKPGHVDDDENAPWLHPFIHAQAYSAQQYGHARTSKDFFYPSMEVSEIEISGFKIIYASDPPNLLDGANFSDLEQVYIIQHGGWWTDIEILPSWGSPEPTSRVGYLGIIFMTEALCKEGSDPQGDRRCLRKPDGPCRKFVHKFKHCSRYHLWSTISPGPRHLWSAGGISRTKSGNGVSSFTVMDVILRQINQKSHFPSLKRIEIVGQCSGAAFLYLYSLITKSFAKLQQTLNVRLLLANPAYYSWSGEDRPFQPTCAGKSDWPYGSNLDGMIHLRHRSLRAYPEVPTYIFSGTRDSSYNPNEPCARIAQGASHSERARFYAQHLLETSGDVALKWVTFVQEEAAHDYLHLLMERRPFVSLLRDVSIDRQWDTYKDYSCSEPSKVINASVPVTGWGECQAMCDINNACKVATLWETKSCSTYEYCTYGLARTKLKSFKRKSVMRESTCPNACRKHEAEGCVSFFVTVNPDNGTSECELLQKRAGRHELAIRPGFDDHPPLSRRRRRRFNSDFAKVRKVRSEDWLL